MTKYFSLLASIVGNRFANPYNIRIMGRKKVNDEAVLRHPVKTRVNESTYRYLQELLVQSRHRTISEVIRQILNKKEIRVLKVSADFVSILEEMARIRSEVNTIGNNINQVVKRYHSTPFAYHKNASILILEQQMNQVNTLLENLQPVISEISKKWLQK